MTTNYPVLMQCFEDLVNTKRFFDAEQLLADARAYCRATPPPAVTWELVAEGMCWRMYAEKERAPTMKELADRLIAAKLFDAATKEILEKVLA